MNTVANNEPLLVALKIMKDSIVAQLTDGRSISFPIAWSWRLANATPVQRKHFEIIGGGQGVHWPDIDEDLSVRGMLQGIPAIPPKSTKAKRRTA